MELKRFFANNKEIYDYAMGLYERNFPYCEKRERSFHNSLMDKKEFVCSVAADNGSFVGIAFYWETEGFIYLEHLCIDEGMRKKGCGSKILGLLKEKGKQIILEIEPVCDLKTQKRLEFYEKNGFFQNGYLHIQPKYHQGDADLVLWVMSDQNMLTQNEYDEFYGFLKENVEIKA